jgi:hypothetical protein
MSDQNIRRHQRIPYTGPVRISWQGADGVPRYVLGKSVDISPGGLRMESPEPIPARTIISFTAEQLKLSGSASVRHVGHRGAKYILGLELNSALLQRTLSLAAEALATARP